jgi:hypothetical protein
LDITKRGIANALITGFVVDHENPLPWLEELAGFKNMRQEHALPLTGPPAEAWVLTAYKDDQMDISFSERLSFNSEVDQPETPAEAEVDDAITSFLAHATDLNVVVAAVGGAALDEHTDAPMNASWAVTAGDSSEAPGSCNFLNVVVLVPDGRIVAIVCSAHGEWVQSAAHHISKKHTGIEFPPGPVRQLHHRQVLAYARLPAHCLAFRN